MIGLLAAAVGAAVTVAATGALVPATTPNRATIEAIVRDYILANPEILPQAMERLQGRETSKAIETNRSALETPFRGAWEGAATADVTLVQFFDYQCGYCRASLPDIDRLLREDRKLRIVYRELPVLGPASSAAALLSLKAASDPVRYGRFHRAAYAAGRLDDKALGGLARQFDIAGDGVPDPAVSREIEGNTRLQNALRVTGTPTWVIGDRMLAGAVGFDELKSAIAEARAARK